MAWLSDFLQGIPLNAVLKERIALAEQKYKDLDEANKKLQETVAALTTENASLQRQLDAYAVREKSQKPTIQWGCYKFEGEEGLYCPACYDTKGKKHLTTRLNTHRRKCSVCQAELGS